MAFKLKTSKEDYIVQFTFNSFKYMEDIEISNEIERYPFKAITYACKLLLGGLNWNPKKLYDSENVHEIIEDYLNFNDDATIETLLSSILAELESSNFFKKNQNAPKKKITSKANSQ